MPLHSRESVEGVCFILWNSKVICFSSELVLIKCAKDVKPRLEAKSLKRACKKSNETHGREASSKKESSKSIIEKRHPAPERVGLIKVFEFSAQQKVGVQGVGLHIFNERQQGDHLTPDDLDQALGDSTFDSALDSALEALALMLPDSSTWCN